MKNYKIVHDVENVYADGTIISSDNLIEDYLDVCNSTEDADLIGWLYTLKQRNTEKSIRQAVDFIADMWGIKIEEIR